jgi:sulfide:quinone oxidoreductase
MPQQAHEAGAWTKRLLHSAFLWKLQAKPGWKMIPE